MTPMTSALPDAATLEQRKAIARAWFETLRDDICAAFERLEDALPAGAPLAERAPGGFVRTPWERTDHSSQPGGGGGVLVMSGRGFGKGGGDWSTGHGGVGPGICGQSSRAPRGPRV